MPNDNALGQYVQQRRELLDLSARQAAKLADISEGYWRQVEKGYAAAAGGLRVPVNPSPRVLRAIARALKVDAARLMTLAGIELGTDPADADELQTQAVVDAILSDERLPHTDREHLANQYRLMVRLQAQTKAAPSLEEQEAAASARLMDELAQEPTAAEQLRRPPRDCQP